MTNPLSCVLLVIVSLLWVASVLFAGFVEPVVLCACILDDAEPLCWLTSLEFASLEFADLDASESFSRLTSMESASLDAATLDIVESLVDSFDICGVVHSTPPITKKKYAEILLRYRRLFVKGDVFIGE